MEIRPAIQPQPLYIADPREGFLNWMADMLVERIIDEVEKEEQSLTNTEKPQTITHERTVLTNDHS